MAINTRNFNWIFPVATAAFLVLGCNQESYSKNNGAQTLTANQAKKVDHSIPERIPDEHMAIAAKNINSLFELSESKCADVFDILPQCADSSGVCMENHASAFLPGAPRRALAAINDKGFNIKAFDQLCYDTCKSPNSAIDYDTFKQSVCRNN